MKESIRAISPTMERQEEENSSSNNSSPSSPSAKRVRPSSPEKFDVAQELDFDISDDELDDDQDSI